MTHKRGGKASRAHEQANNAHSSRQDLPATFWASEEQLRARLERRRSNAAAGWRNRFREMKFPGRGNRKNWKQDSEES